MSTSVDKNYHHGALRTALVAAALALLAEDGADAVSLRAVARRAGVSAMAPYRHYTGKEALLAAVAAHGFDGLRSVLHAAETAVAADQALLAQAVAYVRYALDNPALFRLMFGPRRLGVHPGLTASSDAAYGVLAARVAAEAPEAADCEARVLGCWAMVHGLALLLLDGQLEGKVAVPVEELTRRVGAAMIVTNVRRA